MNIETTPAATQLVNSIESTIITPFRHWKAAREIQSFLKKLEKDSVKMNSLERDDDAKYDGLVGSFILPHKEITFPPGLEAIRDFSDCLPRIEYVEARLRVREGKFVLTYFGLGHEHYGQRPIFSNRALTTIRLTHAVAQGLTLEKLKEAVTG